MSAKRTARWRGCTGIVESPESPEYDFSGSEDTCTKIFEGPFSTLLSSRPARGAEMAGVDTGFQVDRVKIRRSQSTKGTMTVTLTRAPSAQGGAEQQPQYEIEWSEVDKALATHPRYAAGGATELSDADRANIEAWENETDPDLKRQGKFKAPSGEVVTLGTNAKAYAWKLFNGTSHYPVYIPVARKTSLARQNVSGTSAGHVETPSGDFGTLPKRPGGADFIWVKTADRSVRTGKHGKWQRVQEWTGFDKVDTDLIP
jgi:hypothetical protein